MNLWPYKTPVYFFLPSLSKMGMLRPVGPVGVLWLGERQELAQGGHRWMYWSRISGWSSILILNELRHKVCNRFRQPLRRSFVCAVDSRLLRHKVMDSLTTIWGTVRNENNPPIDRCETGHIRSSRLRKFRCIAECTPHLGEN